MYTLAQNNPAAINDVKLNTNYTVVSALTQLDCKLKYQGFGIAFVLDGVENYTINKKGFKVSKGQYLLANFYGEERAHIDSIKNVNGICIKLQPQIISKAVASYLEPNNPDPHINLDLFFNTPSFLNNTYESNNTQVGSCLKAMSEQLASKTINSQTLNESFYFEIANRVVIDHIPIYKQLQNIPSVKDNTKKELYLRLLKGKEFMDANFNIPLKVETIAQQATLSEFHFFRLFKQVFKVTPHQYLIKKRLEAGKNILQQDKYSVTDAAAASGFGDVYSFSKAFKKQYGVVPSLV